MTKSQRRAAVLGNFTHYFGPKAEHPREYFEANWTPRGVDARLSRSRSPARGSWSPTATCSESRWAGSTGRAPRPRPTGTATWTGRCARASGPRRRSWTSCEARVPPRVARWRSHSPSSRSRPRQPRTGRAGTRASSRWSASPASRRARTSPEGGSTRAPTRTPPAEPSRRGCGSTRGSGALLHSWSVPGQNLSGGQGVQVATSDPGGRLVLLDRDPARVLILNPQRRVHKFHTYARFPDLAPCLPGTTARTARPRSPTTRPSPTTRRGGRAAPCTSPTTSRP